MLAALTTVSRVRDRMGFTTSDLADPILTDFISDQQVFIERTTRCSYVEGDDDFELARSVVTDLAAMMALVRLTGGTTSGLDYKIGKLDVTKKGQLENRLRVIFELKVRAREPLTAQTPRSGVSLTSGRSKAGREWARPNLNRGQRHPKAQGYQTTPRALRSSLGGASWGSSHRVAAEGACPV